MTSAHPLNRSSARVTVIGAGAAGTTAAIFAARAGAHVTLLERTRDGGRKILISGGGRCNILPEHLDETRFVTDSSVHTLRNMQRAWPLNEQVAFFENELHIPLVVEAESAKRFPVSNKARDVRDALLNHARQHGVTVRMESLVTGIAATSAGWKVEVSGASPLSTDALIVATGGLSVPNTGSDGRGLSWLESLGHEMHPQYPALTPILADDAGFAALAGVSLNVTISAKDAHRSATATGGFLFTHRGYSGPAVLDVSHVITRSQPEPSQRARLTVQWTSLGVAEWEQALRAQGNRTVIGVLRTELPERLARHLLERVEVDAARPLSELRRDERLRLIDALVRYPLPWIGDEGYKKAEVTGGGLSLAEVDPRTLESRRCPGLFICGEALDAFGPIGGYNFAWAWATGRSAGQGTATMRARAQI